MISLDLHLVLPDRRRLAYKDWVMKFIKYKK